MTNDKIKTVVIIVAGGSGKRMGKPKQFLPLMGKPIVERTVKVFKNCKSVSAIILVVPEEDFAKAKGFGVKLASAGKERTDSVRSGLKLVPADADIVLIHDGARPLITQDIIKRVIAAVRKTGAAIAGVPVKDTIKTINNKQYTINKTLDRDSLWMAQTPQAFKKDIIMKAYAKAKGPATDDAKLAEDLGVKVIIVMGSYENIKITTPEDILAAEAILKGRNALSR